MRTPRAVEAVAKRRGLLDPRDPTTAAALGRRSGGPCREFDGSLEPLGRVMRDQGAKIREAAGDDVHARLDDGPADEIYRGPCLVCKGLGAEEDGCSDDGRHDST